VIANLNAAATRLHRFEGIFAELCLFEQVIFPPNDGHWHYAAARRSDTSGVM
jgi:hypothetical protein